MDIANKKLITEIMKKTIIILLLLFMGISLDLRSQVYYLNEDSKLVQLPLAAWTIRNSYFGKYEEGGIQKEILVMDGKTADTEIPSDNVVFFIKQNNSDSNYKAWKLAAVQQKKDKREMPTSKKSIVFGDKSLIKYIPLKYESIADDIFMVTPEKPLKNGEYLLFYLNSGGGGGWQIIDHRDFSVPSKKGTSIKMPTKNEILATLSPGTIYSTPKQPEPSLLADNNEKIYIPSDVDSNIPKNEKEYDNMFALIIANENYKYAENVPFAINDGKTIKNYFTQALGIPSSNVTYLENATLNDIKFSLNRLEEICSVYGDDARLWVYYSGHGVPDEKSGEAFLLPTDGYATDPSTALKISEFYRYLNNLPTSQVVLFMDACFSGAQRSTQDKMIASARGVAIKAKTSDIPKGNLVVFSAAQGDQTALPFESKSHGLMTYFILKKIQEGNPRLTLGELSDYVLENVRKVSVIENKKSQTPHITSSLPEEKWRNLQLR